MSLGSKAYNDLVVVWNGWIFDLIRFTGFLANRAMEKFTELTIRLVGLVRLAGVGSVSLFFSSKISAQALSQNRPEHCGAF